MNGFFAVLAAVILAIIVFWLLSGCIIGRLDSDNLRIIPWSEVPRMDSTPWHPQPHTLNESIEKANK